MTSVAPTLQDTTSRSGGSLRTLMRYFLIGGLFLAGKGLYDRAEVEGPTITVSVRADATDAEVTNAIREAILLNEARRYGWDRRDPVVFSHLVRNMRFIEPDSPDDDVTLYARALEMNMHAHDPIVRARLLYRARQALELVPEERVPSREELKAHLAANPERFEREGRVRFQQVFLSGTKRGNSLAGDAAAMRNTLAGLGEGEAPVGLGDPLPGLRSEMEATSSDVRDDYGADVADVVSEGVVGVWRGPVRSVYGLHFIRVLETTPAVVPDLDAIEAEVRAHRLGEIREELRTERMAALRDAYDVRIERTR
jgi:hypothetical protein